MSDDLYSDVYDDGYDEQPEPNQGGPKALREAYEKEKEARRALEERLAKLETKDQTKSLATALEGKGVNPKVAKLALKEGVTPDKLDDWLSEWGDVFGIEQTRSSEGVDETTKQQLQAVSGAPTGTAPATGGDAVAHLNGLDNEGDFWAYIKSQQ